MHPVAGAIKAATAGMQPMPGFIPMYWDAKKGKIWFEIHKFDTEILYYSSLPAGVGSNDIGLDRGKDKSLPCYCISPLGQSRINDAN